MLGGTVLFFMFSQTASHTLSGEILDADSELPIYGATITFNNKTKTLYTTKQFELTKLSQKTGFARIQAPGYFDEPLEVDLPAQKDFRIPLRGKSIPGATGIVVWTHNKGDNIIADIRLVDEQRIAIESFPKLDFTGEASIFENIGSIQSPKRGSIVFQGEVPLYFDPSSSFEKIKGTFARDWIKTSNTSISLGILEFTLYIADNSYSWTLNDFPLKKEVP